jgi:hypothetical protein
MLMKCSSLISYSHVDIERGYIAKAAYFSFNDSQREKINHRKTCTPDMRLNTRLHKIANTSLLLKDYLATLKLQPSVHLEVKRNPRLI